MNNSKNFEYFLNKFSSMKSQRDKGTVFEKAVIYFLENDAVFKQQFKKIFTWKQWVKHYESIHGTIELTQADEGIDLVGWQRDDSTYVAIQCKFKNFNKKLYKSDLDSFFSTVDSDVGRKYFCRSIIVDTSAGWSDKLTNRFALTNTFTRLTLNDINSADYINWKDYFVNKKVTHKPIKELYDYQKDALREVVNKFNKRNDKNKPTTRGKLIMACGTGKTFVSLKITEKLIKNKGLVLFLVPSLALINQTVREWCENESLDHSTYLKYAICSDKRVGKVDDIALEENEENDELSVTTHELSLPVGSDLKKITNKIKKNVNTNAVIIFSTYQSIDKVIKMQKLYKLPEFDLVICDEAHRTATIAFTKNKKKNIDDNGTAFFTDVHSNENIQAKKRLYMTATPKVYVERVKREAQNQETDLFSMDDYEIFGEEFYIYDFNKAIKDQKLVDIRLLLGWVNSDVVNIANEIMTNNKIIVKYFKNRDKELAATPKTKKRKIKEGYLTKEDFYKLIVVLKQFSKICWNRDDFLKLNDTLPMKRAMGFTSRVKKSKDIAELFPVIVDEYILTTSNSVEHEKVSNVAVKHIDGTITGYDRQEKLRWLKKRAENTCKLITNVNCLSEGVDVPSLDGVVFLDPRQDEINIIQCIGRAMRTAPGKKYGYIMIPLLVEKGEDPLIKLNNSKEHYKISKIINAIQSIDITLNAEIGSLKYDENHSSSKIITNLPDDSHVQTQFEFNDELIDRANFQAKWFKSILVNKAYKDKHWEYWIDTIASKALNLEKEIEEINKKNPEVKEMFNDFKKTLKQSIHSKIRNADVITLVNQHLITSPIFNSLFQNTGGLKDNVVAQGLNNIIKTLADNGIKLEDEDFKNFYKSISNAVEPIQDNFKAKQGLLNDIYNSFFKKAFPNQSKSLGINYTPIEVIDFIINSVNWLLKKELNTDLSAKNVSIVDPFTGTGSFITHLINSNHIHQKDLLYKYENELHANEIMLLPYYIASVNIAATFEQKAKTYLPFKGIVLTDTFAAYESEIEKHHQETSAIKKLDSSWEINEFNQNYKRLNQQKKAKIKVIIGNPPYSGKKDPNSNIIKVQYDKLDNIIKKDYGRKPDNLYIQAIKWATMRLAKTSQGIIAFITPNSFIATKTYKKMRAYLSAEQASIYIFDLKGDRNKFRRGFNNEGENIFNEVRLGTCIFFLVKNIHATEQGKIYYYTFPQILKQEEKLTKISQFNSLEKLSPHMEFSKINKQLNWINQGNDVFFNETYYLPLRKKETDEHNYIFNKSTYGIISSREHWTWNFSKEKLANNIRKTIHFYNQECNRYGESDLSKNILMKQKDKIEKISKFVKKENVKTKISWGEDFYNSINKGNNIKFNFFDIQRGLYRPFSFAYNYFNKNLNWSLYRTKDFFKDNQKTKGIVISRQNPGKVTALVVNQLMYYSFINSGMFFPLEYNETKKNNGSQDSSMLSDSFTKENKEIIENINSEVYNFFQYQGKPNVTNEDIFNYIYGLLNSNSYSKTFSENLKNDFPRIPKVKDYITFLRFKEIGETLVKYHLNFETHPITRNFDYKPDEYTDDDFKIRAIKFEGKPGKWDTSTIIYNSKIKLVKIPSVAYEYKLMNKSVINLFLDRWKIKTKSGIVNDPNDYAISINNPRYILETLLRVINLAIDTQDKINELPDLDWTNKNLFEKIEVKD